MNSKNSKNYWEQMKNIYQSSGYDSVEKRYRAVFNKRNKKIKQKTLHRNNKSNGKTL